MGPTDLNVCVDFVIPMHATAGGRYIFRDAKDNEKADLELDVKWENWSNASNINVTVDGRSFDTGLRLQPSTVKHGFKDVWDVRLGGSYHLSDVFELRGGVAYDTAAAPNSWTRLDLDGMDRATFAVGAAYDFKTVKADIGLAYVFEPSRTVTPVNVGANPSVDSRVQPDPVQPLFAADQQDYDPINNGKYSGGYLVLMFGLTANW
jgi:long-subunit fatty acid transport protein